MTPSADLPLHPPGLDLQPDDVVEAVEEIDDHDLPDDREGIDLDPTEVVEVTELTEPERTSGFDGVGTRRESRERALALLYEAEQKGLVPLASVVDLLPVAPEAYAAELVVGVSDHLEALDELLGTYAVGWTVVRMPAIDRALLRIGAYELAHTDVPVGACISEAVELAKRYSTDESHRFVNGLLSRLAAELRPEAS